MKPMSTSRKVSIVTTACLMVTRHSQCQYQPALGWKQAFNLPRCRLWAYCLLSAVRRLC